MAEPTKNIIKRTYDEYQNQDYRYGTDSATNLNPVREIKFDQIEIIRKRLQEVTDDIVRKKIVREPVKETPITITAGGGAGSGGALPSPNSMLRQAAQINVGSIGLGVLFPLIDGPENGIQRLLEPIIGIFPSANLIGDLDKPLSLDCEEILKQYDLSEDTSSLADDVADLNNDIFGPNGENLGRDGSGDGDNGDGSDSGGSDDSGGDNNGDDGSGENGDDENLSEDLTDFEECALIELTWLKIILIILRIIKIIQIIVDIVLAIIVPLLEIVMLALICWLVPPAAEQLRQRITEMVLALVTMIISKLIQMIFNLLNLDCLCDQTMDIINQIRQALSAFSSLMSILNVNSISMTANNALDQLQDPVDKIAEMFNNKKEAWDKMKEEYKNFNIKDAWEKSKDQYITGRINSYAQNPNVQKVAETGVAAYNLIKDDVMGLISGLKKAKAATATTSSVKIEPGSATEDNLIKAAGNAEMEK
jgi:hypothetical protein